MKLYNTRTKSTQTLAPLDNETVRIYSCGPTVYDHAHIGNLSAYIFADTLRRTVATEYKTLHAMNYTDVDDKTIRRSHEMYADESPHDALKHLTDTYIELFLRDMKQIGNSVDALQFIRATDESVITGMQSLITNLHEAGFAYLANDGVYFSIEAYRASGKIYGQLLELTSENTSEARIQNDEYDKASAHDFALWKKQRDGEPAWPFTLDGQDVTGRPGWHIECSVMSRSILGQPFDIHTGGIDLIFPHHENEIAQSTAGEDNPIMATIFAHNEHVLVDGKKMAKSAQNFYTLQDLEAKGFDPLAFRMLVLQSHYRSQAHFSWETLEAAENRLHKLRAMAELRWQTTDDTTQTTMTKDVLEEYLAAITAALQDDLNTPKALAELSAAEEIISSNPITSAVLPDFIAFLESLDRLLSLNLADTPDISDEQKALIQVRVTARDAKDWAAADLARDTLLEQGISLRDTPNGVIWVR